MQLATFPIGILYPILKVGAEFSRDCKTLNPSYMS